MEISCSLKNRVFEYNGPMFLENVSCPCYKFTLIPDSEKKKHHIS